MTMDTRSNQYGKVLGDWHIRETVGAGSKGTVVYRITKRDQDGMWEEICALKAIPLIQEWGRLDSFSPERREAYYRAVRKRKAIAREEVKAMEKVRGESNIVTYIDSDAVEWETENAFGCDFLIRMEYLHDLRKQIDSDKIFTEKEIVQIGTDICNAIAECHRVNILHRDIKPENIFISDSGKYKLGDFGISRIMDECPGAYASTGIGTPEYAAPEQGSGKYDRRVDIYSLGIVLYELGNHGLLPFAQSKYLNGDEVLRRLSNEPIPEPDGVSPALARVILKACAFDPQDRYQTAEEFAEALRSAVGLAKTGGEPADVFVTLPVSASEKLPKVVPVYFRDRTVSVRIPKNVKDGSILRISGAGNWDQTTGRRGDLLVTIHTEPSGSRKLPILAIAACAVLILLLAAVWLVNSGKKDLPDTDTEPSVSDTEQSVTESEERIIPTETVPEAVLSYIPKQYIVIDGGRDHTVILYNDGTVKAIGSNRYGQCDVADWTDIVQISTQGDFTVGLKADGTVVAAGDNSYGQCDVRYWTDIVAISASAEHTVGLKADGTVLATGDNENGECRVENWSGIKEISAGDTHTVGLKADGTVVAVGKNEDGRIDVGKWSSVKEVCAGAWHTIALKTDGSVLSSGYGGPDWQDARDWKNITMIAAGNMFTVGLDENGNVHFGGVNDVGQRDSAQWSDIVYLATGSQHIIGVRKDGSVVSAGANDWGQGEITQEDLFPEQ